MLEQDSIEKNFRFASSLIKIIALMIAIMVLIISKYAFIFLAAAILPTVFTIFFNKNHHKCLLETIYSFKLIGIFSYFIRIWESKSVNFLSKQILLYIKTWMDNIRCCIYWSIILPMPLLIIKIYSVKVQVQVRKYKKQYKELCNQ